LHDDRRIRIQTSDKWIRIREAQKHVELWIRWIRIRNTARYVSNFGSSSLLLKCGTYRAAPIKSEFEFFSFFITGAGPFLRNCFFCYSSVFYCFYPAISEIRGRTISTVVISNFADFHSVFQTKPSSCPLFAGFQSYLFLPLFQSRAVYRIPVYRICTVCLSEHCKQNNSVKCSKENFKVKTISAFLQMEPRISSIPNLRGNQHVRTLAAFIFGSLFLTAEI
jgi:hypothetical protein